MEPGFGSHFTGGAVDILKIHQPRLPFIQVFGAIEQFDHPLSGEVDLNFDCVFQKILTR